MVMMSSAQGVMGVPRVSAGLAVARNGVALAAMLGGAVPALAQSDAPDAAAPAAPVVTLSGEYILDAVAVVRGIDEGVRYVDLAALTGEVDLDAAAGWRGARLVAQVIAGTGQQPNDLAGTLQGINNSEVPRNRVKLYQFYLAQQFADWPVTVRVGFIDLNEEFYSNDAAGLLIAPAFGIGSELAATGPNGPAIFPSTALTAAVRVEPSDDTYAAFAVVNAEAGVLGDVGGVRPLLDEGALLIGEAGWAGSGKIALGAWSYTRRQDDIRLLDANGDPLHQRAQGAYALLEWPIGGPIAPEEGAPRKASLFARAGVSDGHTTPYSGGWQAGILINNALPGRPDSQLSFGANQAFLSDKFRLNEGEAGNPLRRAETGLEVILADQVAPWLNVQADAQYVRNPSQAAGTRDAVIFGLRFVFSFTQEW
jgi:porin